MTNTENEQAQAGLIAAMNGKFENKIANKKDDVSGDFSSDTASYPTVRAMKAEDALKVNISDVKNNLTSTDVDKPLSANQGKILDEKITQLGTNSASDLAVTVEQQQTPETGFASTYVVKQGGVQVGSKINVLKDKMLRSVSVETVGATPNTLESANNLSTGDTYILMVVNTVDNDGATSLILPISDWVDLQTGDNTSIVVSNSGVISVKPGYVEGIINDYLTAMTNLL